MAAEAAYRAASLRTGLLELLDHAIEIGIAGAEAPCQPVPIALGDPLAISDNLELTGLPTRKDGFNVEALLDEGRETRDLGSCCPLMSGSERSRSSSVLQSASCREN